MTDPSAPSWLSKFDTALIGGITLTLLSAIVGFLKRLRNVCTSDEMKKYVDEQIKDKIPDDLSAKLSECALTSKYLNETLNKVDKNVTDQIKEVNRRLDQITEHLMRP